MTPSCSQLFCVHCRKDMMGWAWAPHLDLCVTRGTSSTGLKPEQKEGLRPCMTCVPSPFNDNLFLIPGTSKSGIAGTILIERAIHRHRLAGWVATVRSPPFSGLRKSPGEVTQEHTEFSLHCSSSPDPRHHPVGLQGLQGFKLLSSL